MRKKISIVLVIIWMIFIFIMSSFDATDSANQSGFFVNLIANIFNINNIDMLTLIVRKLAHFTEYFILGILLINVIMIYHKRIYLGIVIAIIYVLTDEIHQIFVPGRTFKIMDIFIDTLGVLIGMVFYYIVRGKFDKKR